ncbi:uncharacterized protein [Primulina eburnea]|uniref:uncharacterized protein n=1 Tax=Primulina eburnea TaxID=1245227 RepID=UPI003C6CBE09
MQPVLSASDNSLPFQITSFKLSGRNYLQWSRSVQLIIRGKGRFGYLDGSISTPNQSDPSFAAWDIQNSMVMAWLLHSMDDSIAEIYLHYPTAKAIWDAVALAYSDLEDSNQMFDLRTRSRNLRQDDGTWTDAANREIYQKLLAKERTYDFLTGLHPSLDDARGRILSFKPLPSLDTIFSEVRREEQRKQIMLGEATIPVATNHDASAKAARGSRKPQLWSEHCNRPHHTKATCWKLHGKPADWVPRSQRNAESTKPAVPVKVDNNTPSSAATFSQAQLNQLGQFLSTSTSLMAHGTSSSVTDPGNSGSGLGEDDLACC